MNKPIAILLLVLMPRLLSASEFHVAMIGNDTNRGTKESPLRTIQRAADMAQPHDKGTGL